jgi:protein FRA10AC1
VLRPPCRPPRPPRAGQSSTSSRTRTSFVALAHTDTARADSDLRRRFLRDDDAAGAGSWDDQLAQKYYDSLARLRPPVPAPPSLNDIAQWKEFAVCDLKHYRSGRVRRPAPALARPFSRAPQFALRWRTEAEVLSGAGERACANTRCALHSPLPGEERVPGLATLELPFAYAERGAQKRALVKVVLCAKCVRKIMWKRARDRADAGEGDAAGDTEPRRRRSSRSRSPGGVDDGGDGDPARRRRRSPL